jgi:protein gp37
MNCYAERMAKRLQAMGNPNYQKGFEPAIHDHVFEAPLKWKTPRTIFVNSMSDLFLDVFQDEVIMKLFDIMNRAHWHTFQVLTKRSDRLLRLSPRLEWTRNIWMGVTIENQECTYRMNHLRESGAKVKFLSMEPLLGPVFDLDLNGIDWVIVGGESGPKARPMDAAWVLSIRDACVNRRVPFFFKQWGGVNKKKNGRSLEGKVWGEMPHLQSALAV